VVQGAQLTVPIGEGLVGKVRIDQRVGWVVRRMVAIVLASSGRGRKLAAGEGRVAGWAKPGLEQGHGCG